MQDMVTTRGGNTCRCIHNCKEQGPRCIGKRTDRAKVLPRMYVLYTVGVLRPLWRRSGYILYVYV